jgi:hypothetical protein
MAGVTISEMIIAICVTTVGIFAEIGEISAAIIVTLIVIGANCTATA